MTYSLRLLGSFEIHGVQTNEPTAGLVRKTRALLAYLAASGKLHTRRSLYRMFCQQANDPAGALRWHLSRIRRQLSPQILRAQGPEVGLDPSSVQTDYESFTSTLADPSARSTEELSAAIGSYRGEFLSDLSLPDSREFELWLLGERSHCQRLYENGARELIARKARVKRYDEAIDLARAVLQSNPLLEPIHLQLIWLYAQTGQPQAALEQGAQCRAILWQELAVHPTDDLETLLSSIRDQQPLPSPLITEVLPQIELDRGPRSPFIAREVELKTLREVWESVAPRGQQVVTLEAEAGGGKTRLLQEFAGLLGPVERPLSGRCYQSTQSIPYQLWQPILEARLHSLEAAIRVDLMDRWGPQLALLLPGIEAQPGKAPDQQQFFRAVAELLLHTPPAAPLCLFLEDLQWADDASLQLVQYVITRADRWDHPVLMIGTFRSEEIHDKLALMILIQDLERSTDLTRIVLPPFDRDDVETLVTSAEALGSLKTSPSDLGNLILKATAGNPLFTIEILQELSLHHDLPRDLPMPPSLIELVQRRLDHLKPNVRQVIETLAVLNHPAHFDLAQHVSARTEEETLAAVESGVRWRILQPRGEGDYEFRHELVRQAVIERLTSVRRQRLHHRIASRLSVTDADPATVAYHWSKAGDLEKESEFAMLAGEMAADVYAHEEAIRHYLRVIDIATSLTQRLDAMCALGTVWHFTGRWTEAERLFHEAYLLAQDGDLLGDRARSSYHLGLIELDKGNYEQAMQRFLGAEAAYEHLDDQQGLCRVAGGVGTIHTRRSEHARARARYERQLELADEIGSLPQKAEALTALGSISYQLADYERAIDLCQQSLTIEEALNNRPQISALIGNLGLIHMRRGDYSAAVQHFLRRLEIAEELEHEQSIVKALNSAGTIYRLQGEISPALDCLRESVTRSLALGDQQGLSLAAANLGGTLLLNRQYSDAERWLNLAIMLARKLNLRFVLCAYLHQMVLLQMEQERWQEASAINQEAMDLAADIDRKDIQFGARNASTRLQVLLGEKSLQEGVADFRMRLTATKDREEQADLYYEIWRLDPSCHDAGEAAAEAYRTLYDRTPDYLQRECYRSITGTDLPDPEALPAPPSITGATQSIRELLHQVDEFVEASSVF